MVTKFQLSYQTVRLRSREAYNYREAYTGLCPHKPNCSIAFPAVQECDATKYYRSTTAGPIILPALADGFPAHVYTPF